MKEKERKHTQSHQRCSHVFVHPGWFSSSLLFRGWIGGLFLEANCRSPAYACLPACLLLEIISRWLPTVNLLSLGKSFSENPPPPPPPSSCYYKHFICIDPSSNLAISEQELTRDDLFSFACYNEHKVT